MNEWMKEMGRWLSVGIGLKRWIVLLLLSLFLFGVALYSLMVWMVENEALPTAVFQWLTIPFIPIWLRIPLFFLVGMTLLIFALVQMGIRLISPFDVPEEGIASLLRGSGAQRQGPSVVVLGGGTGMPSVLRGLREFTENITAIVTVADDGGSSGRLRREFGLLPPGDFRNNMAALSRDEALMTKVLQYRFGANVSSNGQNGLQGHAFGNLLLAALTGITGSFDESLLAAEKVLAMRGRVLPSTLQDITLCAEIERPSGEIEQVVGESRIPEVDGRIHHVYLMPEDVRAYPPALKAIFQADLIVMGPGSLYTSILPNLLIPDIAEALRRASAPKLYICNLATQPGETENYTVADHVATITAHIPADCVDLVLANDNLSVPPEQGGGQTVYVLPEPPPNVQLILTDLVDEKRPWRHDSQKLAQAIWQLLDKT